MAAPMCNASWRSIFGNILKSQRCIKYVPVAAFCEKSTRDGERFKFDMANLEIGSPEIHEEIVTEEKEAQSFATMFRNSKFVQLGNVKDKMVAGRITDVLNNDLYIDFGGKFYCVCPRPSFQADLYVKSQRVKLMLHKFEMSSNFLGSDKHVTLLEADCTLLGLFDPSRSVSEDSYVSGGFAKQWSVASDAIATDSVIDSTETDHDTKGMDQDMNEFTQSAAGIDPAKEEINVDMEKHIGTNEAEDGVKQN